MSNHITDSVAKGRVSLTKKQTFFHYFFALILPLTSLLTMEIMFLLTDAGEETRLFVRKTAYIFSGMFAIWYAVRQYNSLAYSWIQLSISEQEFEKRLAKIAKANDWILEAKGDGYRIFTTHFKWTNWGTLVHVIHTKEAIFYNSICDLYNRPSTFSFGVNQKNYEALDKAFQIV